MPDDAMERLKQIHQQRQSVAARNTSLLPKIDNVEPESTNQIESKPNDSIESKQNASQTLVNQGNTAKSTESLVTIRSTIRLEQDVDQALRQLCAEERITKELFLEAALHLCQQDPQLMQAALTEAKKRYKLRKAAGEDRRFETMKQKRENRD